MSSPFKDDKIGCGTFILAGILGIPIWYISPSLWMLYTLIGFPVLFIYSLFK